MYQSPYFFLGRTELTLSLYSYGFFLFFNRFQAGQRSPLHGILNFVKTKLYSQAHSENNPAHRILFIIAERSALNSEKLTALPAEKLHDDGIEVFLLAVGTHVTNNGPKKVASKPFKTHLFRVNSYPDLFRLSRTFKGKGELLFVSHIFVHFCVKSKTKMYATSALEDFYHPL